MFLAYSLEHFDGGNAVETALNIAIIGQLDIDQIGKPRFCRDLFGKGALFLRKRDASDAATIFSRYEHREAAPAAPDFQNAMSGFQLQDLSELLPFVALG